MRRPTRRSLLAAAGGTLLAGCSDEPGERAPYEVDEPVSIPETERVPGDDEIRDRCPRFRTYIDAVVCYEGVDPDATAVLLEPSTTVFEVSETVSFTLSNDGTDPFRTRLSAWLCEKRVDDSWFPVEPPRPSSHSTVLRPGDERVWEVRVDNDGIERGELASSDVVESDVSLRGFGPGTYAFGVYGSFEGTGRGRRLIIYAATVELDGEPLEVTPTNAVERIEWEGETLIGYVSSESDANADADPESGVDLNWDTSPDDTSDRRVVIDLERLDALDGSPRRIVTEQVLGRPRLRDAIGLSVERDADRVRLVSPADDYAATLAEVPDVFEYDGTNYAFRVRELEVD